MTDSLAHKILVNFSGPHRDGCIRHIGNLLGAHSVQVEDIGQAVMHNHLNLSLVLTLNSETETAMILKDLVFGAAHLGLQIRFTGVQADHVLNQPPAPEQKRYILTILTRKLLGKHLAPITQALDEQNLSIVRINRLSKTAKPANPNQARTCMEFILEGEPKDLTLFRSTILELSQNMVIDIAFQQDTPFRRNRRLVCFDMDATLIEGEIIDELAYEAGVGDAVSDITRQAMQGTIDFNESFKQRLALLKGLPQERLDAIAERLCLTEGAEKLISILQALGYKTAILSGGFTYFGEILQKRLGIDYMFANELEIQDGVVTGRVIKPVVNGERKAALLGQLTKTLEISNQQVIAVGDGANDLPMLDLAGLGIAFRAKPLVKAHAKQAISHLGLDGILYLMGVTDAESQSLLEQKS